MIESPAFRWRSSLGFYVRQYQWLREAWCVIPRPRKPFLIGTICFCFVENNALFFLSRDHPKIISDACHARLGFQSTAAWWNWIFIAPTTVCSSSTVCNGSSQKCFTTSHKIPYFSAVFCVLGSSLRYMNWCPSNTKFFCGAQAPYMYATLHWSAF